MAFLSLRRLNKIYPNGNRALRDFSLEIEEGEFLVLVGPSGCGKSTLLRMIAGLEEISTGELYIDGKLSNEVSPKNRDIAMVFQNYALYPHLTVFDNMAFGLRLSKLKKDEIKQRVEEAALILGIPELLTRKPGQLSGGQKQRVALGRALVRRPKIFLLDEPLSNVDAKIRAEMRSEILRLHARLGTTFVYVTHDQTEAMTMASRIVVMDKGEIQQVGTPLEVYQEPRNLFVASFIGTPEMNLFDGTLEENRGGLQLVSKGGNPIKFPAYKRYEISNLADLGRPVIAGIRPDNVELVKGQGDFAAKVDFSEYFGANKTFGFALECDKRPFLAMLPDSGDLPQVGDAANLALKESTIHLFAMDGRSILGVPDLEYLEGAVLAQRGSKVILRVQGQEIEAPKTELLIDLKGHLGQALAIGFSPAACSLVGREGALKLTGTVKHRQNLIQNQAVYLELKDRSLLSFKVAKDAKLKDGDELSFYLDLAEAAYYDKKDGDRLSTKFPLFENKIALAKKGQKLAFHGRPLLLSADLRPGEYLLSPTCAIHSEKHFHAPHLSLLVIDDECLGSSSVVYAKSQEGDYFSFIVPSPFDRHNEPKIKVAVTKGDLTPLN